MLYVALGEKSQVLADMSLGELSPEPFTCQSGTCISYRLKSHQFHFWEIDLETKQAPIDRAVKRKKQKMDHSKMVQ